MSNVAVFGLGYVGCVSAGCLSRDGHAVIGVDLNPDKVDCINRGVPPITETGLDELLSEAVEQGTLCATTSSQEAVEKSDVALVAVGTPSARDGSLDYSSVERVVEAIGSAILETDRPYTVVIRSTLLPGVLEERLAPVLDKACGFRLGNGVSLCNNPEFLRETTAIRDYNEPPFVVVGAAEESDAAAVLQLYDRIDAETVVTDTRTAALVKYACNAYHAVKIAFANEIGVLAETLETDGSKVMEIVCKDKQLNVSAAYLKPGFAFGGSCLPKDVRALARLAQQRGMNTELMASVLPSNDAHLARAVTRIEESGCRRIGLVGLSFKAGTDDLRESPLVRLAETLHGRGYDIRIYDPHVRTVELVGNNLSYVEQHLPHLSALMVDEAQLLYNHAELLVLGTGVADALPWRDAFFGDVFDLRRDLIAPQHQQAVKS